MILFKKQFKEKILNGSKITTYRTKRGMYYKKGDIIKTNFKENGKNILIQILDIQEIEKVDFNFFIEDGFDSKKEMEEYFKDYIDLKLFKVNFTTVKQP